VALDRTRSRSMSMRALDLCTGSGCVAITLARERRTSLFLAADVSGDALAVARDNALRLGAYNVAFRQGDLFAAVDPSLRFDLVTANPPYIAVADIDALQPEIREYEPRVALAGGPDGLEVVRLIVAEARAHLAVSGRLVLEVGFGEAAAAAALLAGAGFEQIEVRRDYARVERVVSGVLETP
jgi:release factor glutamine methyltransferase